MMKTRVYRSSLKGRRPTNEDREVIVQNLNGSNKNEAAVNLYMICDGHGGDFVSEFVAQKLRRILTYIKNIYPLEKPYVEKIYRYIQKKLEGTGKALDTGSTALACLLYLKDQRYFLQFINLGDCRAIISYNGMAFAMTKDHKPCWPEEYQRLDGVNCRVAQPKEVTFYEGDFRTGTLSVSRAFGDINESPQISQVPDIFECFVDENVQFVIMGCDGLWDAITNEEAVNFVHSFWKKQPPSTYISPDIMVAKNNPPKELTTLDPNNVAEQMAAYAYYKGSTDNISVIVVSFPWSK